MKSDTLALRKVFEQEIRYVVPMFQRPYVWNQTDQWDPLWDDVVAVAEQLLESDEEDVRPHFLGAIVIVQEPTPVADIDIRLLIDGQQRLTTLQLLLDAVEEVVRQYGDAKDSKLLRKMILNDEDLIAEPSHRYKVWPTNVDQDPFVAAMNDDYVLDSETADRQIARAHIVFGEKAREWAGLDDDPEQARERLHALVNALRGYVQIVVIDLDPSDNPQVIFETLNARGTPLLASDLVKNHLLRKAEQEKYPVQDLYDNYWIQFDTENWRREVRQGRLHRPRIDLFLYHWLVMHVTREVSNTDLFREFQRWVNESGYDVPAVLKSLDEHASTYDRLDAPDGPDDFGTFLYRWRTLQASAMTPLLLWILHNAEDPHTATRCCKLIESWLVRRMVCRATTKGYTHYALQLIAELRESDDDPAMVLQRQLLDSTRTGTEWPTDREVAAAVLSKPLYRQVSRGRLRMLLEALEDHRRARVGKAEEPVTRGALTIEHIMPQAWSGDLWPLPSGDPEIAEDERRVLLHTLGNLTLLNNRLNPSLSNSAWAQKRKGLAEHSVLHLNKSLDRYPTWDEESIRSRGAKIAAELCLIWPRAS